MPAASHPFAKITWESEGSLKEHILKEGDSITLGRGEDNVVIVPSAKVSRHHARIEWNVDRFCVRDLDSSNGTYVSGQRIPAQKPCALQEGDEIRLESVVIRYALIPLPKMDQHLDQMPTMHGLTRMGETPVMSIEVVMGPDRGRRFTVENQATIGRASSNATWEIRLNDSAISRPHARIERRGPAFLLSDLGSANGTMLNGLFVIEPVMLSDGDEFQVGECICVVRIKTPG
ncbi:MAG: FHA domain-containing protein [Anaerolineales bacterium]|nr:FHA domain-containing protein [Anaerolineales bacterium]